MNRPTPQPIRAPGARDAHGTILGREGGSLYVHLHREHGLAHRHYVVRPWQVRLLSVALSAPFIVLYVSIVLLWGWTAQQASRVPFLQARVRELTQDAQRLDTLTATLTELQSRYDQVQRMLSAASAASAAQVSGDPAAPRRDSTRATRGSEKR